MPTPKKDLSTLTKQGAYRPSRHGDRLPPPTDPGEFDTNPPEWLNDLAKQEWNRVCPLLQARGILRPEDHSLLAIYAATFANLRKTLEAGGAPKAADLSAFHNLAGKLGLSPADRSRTLPAELDGKTARQKAAEPAERVPWSDFRLPLDQWAAKHGKKDGVE